VKDKVIRAAICYYTFPQEKSLGILLRKGKKAREERSKTLARLTENQSLTTSTQVKNADQ